MEKHAHAEGLPNSMLISLNTGYSHGLRQATLAIQPIGLDWKQGYSQQPSE